LSPRDLWFAWDDPTSDAPGTHWPSAWVFLLGHFDSLTSLANSMADAKPEGHVTHDQTAVALQTDPKIPHTPVARIADSPYFLTFTHALCGMISEWAVLKLPETHGTTKGRSCPLSNPVQLIFLPGRLHRKIRLRPRVKARENEFDHSRE
jgi:hypothetical protein